MGRGEFKTMLSGAGLSLFGVRHMRRGLTWVLKKNNVGRGALRIYVILYNFKFNFNFLHVLRILKYYLLI